MIGIWSGTYRRPHFWDYFGKRLTELAEIPIGAQVLDVGTGSGAVLFQAAERIGRPGRIVGIDIDHERKTALALRERGVENGQIVQMDARRMGFRDANFDLVLSGFVGWDDIFDFERGEFRTRDDMLLEIARVLKPGGRVGISAWELQDDNEWVAELVNQYLPNASGEWIRSCYSKENEAGLVTILRNSGFSDIRIVREEKKFTYHDEAEWIEVMRLYGWQPSFERIKALSAARQCDFEKDVYAKVRDHKHADGIRFRRIVLFAFGTKEPTIQ